MCVESGKGGVQHAAPHVRVAVVKGIRDEEEEEGRDLGLVQILREFVEGQSDATPGEEREKERERVDHQPCTHNYSPSGGQRQEITWLPTGLVGLQR